MFSAETPLGIHKHVSKKNFTTENFFICREFYSILGFGQKLVYKKRFKALLHVLPYEKHFWREKNATYSNSRQLLNQNAFFTISSSPSFDNNVIGQCKAHITDPNWLHVTKMFQPDYVEEKCKVSVHYI